MSYKNILIIFLFFSNSISLAQEKDSLHLSFFFDGYASWIPSSGQSVRPAYIVNYARLNTVGINFLSANVHYRSKNFRTTMGVMAGDYARQNLVLEEPFARNIYEANMGFKLTSGENIWLDVGVMPSHIGIESVPGQKNINATRNIISDITPYYETGIRMSYLPNEEWYFAVLALNGWQRITAPLNALGNNWGLQISYRPTPHFLINSSSFIGDVQGYDLIGKKRIYSNLYSSIELNPRMSFTLGWDWGMQGGRSYQWNDWLFLCRYVVKHNKLYMASRYELLSDPKGFFQANHASSKAKYQMTSLNIDFLPFHSLMLRTELNYLFANRMIDQNNSIADLRQLTLFFILSAQLDYKK